MQGADPGVCGHGAPIGIPKVGGGSWLQLREAVFCGHGATSDVDDFLYYNLNCHSSFKTVSQNQCEKIVLIAVNLHRPICSCIVCICY